VDRTSQEKKNPSSGKGTKNNSRNELAKETFNASRSREKKKGESKKRIYDTIHSLHELVVRILMLWGPSEGEVSTKKRRQAHIRRECESRLHSEAKGTQNFPLRGRKEGREIHTKPPRAWFNPGGDQRDSGSRVTTDDSMSNIN